ncbi:MAG: amidase [Proteobacteria bacterium]|nr:amidase [Pseudomonadota bacterium]
MAVNSATGPEETYGAFVPGARCTAAPLHTGRLDGLRFAVKDMFDVAGWPTGNGHPDWKRSHPPASGTASAVSALLLAGATLAGKTVMMELAFGLSGENIWYGTPINPRAPDRFPGGSSCGSAVAVAAGLVDFALGSDTAGSVRIPASYCGTLGIRTSPGAVSLSGARALAPGFDTVGWFARDAAVLAEVGETLLDGPAGGVAGPLLRLEEAWMNAAPRTAEALRPALERLERRFGRAVGVRAAPEGIDSFYDHFRTVQAEEVWATLGGWVNAEAPRFGPGVAERIAAARGMDPDSAAQGRAFRQVLRARLRPLLTGGGVLVFPTSPCPAPLLTASQAEQELVRAATIGVTAIAGIAGLPEVTLPAATVNGAPVGLSLVGAHGADRGLLAFARQAMEAIAGG